MERISSSTSSVSSEGTLAIPSVSALYTPKVEDSDLYTYCLKLLVFEYINEARFRKRVEQPAVQRISQDVSSLHLIKRTSMLINDTSIPRSNEDNTLILRDLKKKLEIYLNEVTINKKKVLNQDYRRSLMKFYNDYFLNPNMHSIMEEMNSPEDLIVYFSKTASNQLNKFNVGNIQKELYSEISSFIDMLIKLLPASVPKDFINRLREYETSLNQSKVSKKSSKIPRYQDKRLSNQNQTSEASYGSKNNVPTFRLEQITHSSYFAELFGVDPIKVQQDIIKVSSEVSNDIYCKELRKFQKDIKSGHGTINRDHFTSEKDYIDWESYQLNEITNLFERFESRSINSGELSSSSQMIPTDPRQYFTALMIKIFEKECRNQMRALNLSQDAMFFLTKYSKYWLVDYFSTLSVLLYTALNLSVLDNEEINIQFTENFYSMIKLKILRDETNLDTLRWNDLDQKQWIVNILSTSSQCMNALNNLLTGLFATTKPKFSPILVFYYSYIECDPAVMMFKKYTVSSFKYDINRFRKTIFKASEQHYISLLENIPKDSSIELHHIQDVGEEIIEDIKGIQKRYTKPLLDKLNIAFISASMLISAFVTDFPSMVKRVEKYNKADKKGKIPAVNALELYDVVKELQGIYSQVQSKRPFPFNVEKMFYQYLSEMTNEIIQNVRGVIINSLKNEKWQKVNETTPFSQSVLDIFKMINESIRLVKGFDWGDLYQVARILTIILKSFSDDLKLYSQETLKLIQAELRKASLDAIQESASEELYEHQTYGSEVKKKTRWTFHDMKNALKSSSSTFTPPPFKYRMTTCVMLNDLEVMIKMVNELDEEVEPETISSILDSRKEQYKDERTEDQQLKQIYTVRVIEGRDIRGYSSDGMSNASVSLRCSTKQRESGVTRIIQKTTNPIWDEEFEIDLPFKGKSTVTFNIWHHTSSKLKSFSGDDLCGRCTINLDPRNFTDDGFPNSRTLDLDTQGQLFVQISLETEKLDALFSFGRCYRTLSRSRDRAIELLVTKFSSYVEFSFSRETLNNVCGHNGYMPATDDAIYDAILPLFDYLNANLNILASQLTNELLFMVILRAWIIILKTADNLLLPQLSVAKNKLALVKTSLWSHGSSSTILGYGRALTNKEVEVIFRWLDSLCVDFFHNGGEGPPLQDLKNKDYQRLLLIPVFYDKTTMELKKEVKRLTPSYYKYLDRNYRDSDPNMVISRKLTSVERRKTILSNNFKKTKEQMDKEVVEDQNDPLNRDAETLGIILRILITKGEIDFVYKHLHERKLKKKMIALSSIANKVSMGQKVIYKK